MGKRTDSRLFATAGAFGFGSAAALMGVCCIGPVGVWLFGVGGAVMIARMEPVRPWVLGVAVLCSAYSFWRLYLGPRWRRDARDRRVPAGLRAFFWVSLALVVFAATADQALRVLS